ncbi:MAG: PilZ domain-containing protein [Myxococcota bacterium]
MRVDNETQRRFPRFEKRAEVRIELEGREDFRNLWTQDVSRGGLFVQTNDPPPLHTRLKVTIETPDGSIDLSADVVHVLTQEVAEHFGREPGVGLQFVGLSEEQSHAVDRYVDGIASRLGYSEPPFTADVNEDPMSLVGALFFGYNSKDLYAALELQPSATYEEVDRRTQEWLGRLQEASERSPADEDERLVQAHRLLLRIRNLLLDPQRRSEYDRRQGFLRRETRARVPCGTDEPTASAAFRVE